MDLHEFRLRGIENLPKVSEKIKKNVCMIIATIDPKLSHLSMRDRVVNASSLYALGLQSKGTGFLTSTGHVITAFHVIENSVDIRCLTPTGEDIHLELVRYSKLHDIALLKPKHKWSEGIDISTTLKESLQPRKGELVFTLGYPLAYNGPEPVLSAGFFSHVEKVENVKKFVINAAFNVGNSGGPLFDLQGRLLGIVVAKSISGNPIIDVAFHMLKRPGVELVYGSIELPGGIKEEITLSKIIRMLMRWVLDNVQTNIGEAISIEHLVELLEKDKSE